MVSVSGQCANVQLPSIGQDLVPDKTVFIQLYNGFLFREKTHANTTHDTVFLVMRKSMHDARAADGRGFL